MHNVQLGGFSLFLLGSEENKQGHAKEWKEKQQSEKQRVSQTLGNAKTCKSC
jgi:hypothetical protein